MKMACNVFFRNGIAMTTKYKCYFLMKSKQEIHKDRKERLKDRETEIKKTERHFERQSERKKRREI
jgi:hypothetical protein